MTFFSLITMTFSEANVCTINPFLCQIVTICGKYSKSYSQLDSCLTFKIFTFWKCQDKREVWGKKSAFWLLYVFVNHNADWILQDDFKILLCFTICRLHFTCNRLKFVLHNWVSYIMESTLVQLFNYKCNQSPPFTYHKYHKTRLVWKFIRKAFNHNKSRMSNESL